MQKIWVPVKFDNRYLVSNYGDLFSVRFKRFLKPYKMPNGSLRYTFPNRTIAVHKLVFNHFRNARLIQYKHLIMHLDYNRENNRELNLERMKHGDVLRKWYEYKKQKRGVYKWTDGRYTKWRAALKVGGKVKTLGYYDLKEHAEAAYYEGYKAIFGNYPY